MKANELRIGNYVEKENEIYVADFITIQMAHNYNPIPLTEEWLLKFNAVCQPWGWTLFGVIIRWTIHNEIINYWIELGNGKIIKLPFVHTLQNFFSLTGEELTIK
jgi:hypothetical protein